MVLYLNRTTDEIEVSRRTEKDELNRPLNLHQRRLSKSVCEVHLVHLASSHKSSSSRDHSDTGTV